MTFCWKESSQKQLEKIPHFIKKSSLISFYRVISFQKSSDSDGFGYPIENNEIFLITIENIIIYCRRSQYLRSTFLYFLR